MKNAIIAILVTLAVIGSAIASPVVTVIGVASAANNVIGITTDNSVKTAERKNNDYKANISEVPAPVKNQIGDDEYYENVTTTDFSKGYAGETPIYKEEVKDEKVLNILCMYCDPYGMIASEELDVSALITLNFETKKVHVTTVNNNLYVPIEGHNWNRLGAAIEYGGVGLYINTLNAVFELDIQNYVIIDLSQVDEFIDWAGGIDLKLDQAAVEYFKGKYDFHIGTNHLNGVQTVDLVKAVKDGKITVSEEMTDGFENILDNLMNRFQSTSDISGLLKMLKGLLKTNMDLIKIIEIAIKALPMVKENADVKVESITDDVQKAIVTVQETGKQLAVMIMNSIEQVRMQLKSRIYG